MDYKLKVFRKDWKKFVNKYKNSVKWHSGESLDSFYPWDKYVIWLDKNFVLIHFSDDKTCTINTERGNGDKLFTPNTKESIE